MINLAGMLHVDLKRTAIGLPSRVADLFAGRPVLHHTLARLARIQGLERIIVTHPADQDPTDLLASAGLIDPIDLIPVDPQAADPTRHSRSVARRWSLAGWRGGLGGATVYDEAFHPPAVLAALEREAIDTVILVGADWPLHDPTIADRLIERRGEAPDAMQMTFTQAPPGLAGLCIAGRLLREMSEKHADIGRMLAYLPDKPQPDPIGRDVCVQLPASIRQTALRFIHDTPRARDLLHALADELGPQLTQADAGAVTDVARELMTEARLASFLPSEITLELTPQRRAEGPITPGHWVNLERPPMDESLAIDLLTQIAEAGDVAVTLGGLGDARLHPGLSRIVHAAREAGVFAIALETDLLGDDDDMDALLTLPIDVLRVRLNADTAATYHRAMVDRTHDAVPGEHQAGPSEINLDPPHAATPDEAAAIAMADRLDLQFVDTPPVETIDDDQPIAFKRVIDRLQRLLYQRFERQQAPDEPRPGLPWIVPELIKTADTFADLETFFDRWVKLTHHAVIAGPTTGCGLMPDQSLVRMTPPRRTPCRQIARRMTVHSDGVVPRCDQDWLARSPLGDARRTSLLDLWRTLGEIRSAHDAERFDDLPLCAGCDAWFRS